MFEKGLWCRCGLLPLLLVFLVLAPDLHAAPACKSDPAAGVDWQECDKKLIILRGANISGANLFGADFTSTDLREANLLASNLEKATLVRASLAGASARGANFNRIEAYRTDFKEIDAEGATFTSAEMQRSVLHGANLVNADFTKAELGRAEFQKATITGTRFSLANLARVDFRGTEFTGPLDFENAFFFLTRIESLDLSEAKGLAQWQIDMACGDAETKLPAGLTVPASWPCKFEND
jgi:uncharacterized protein YjbI with pentapeptide repeats